MPVGTPCPISPSAAERVRLKKMAYGHESEHRPRVRAHVVLHAARGRSHACIARETGLHLDTVRRWRGGSPGLSPLQAAGVKALACRLAACLPACLPAN
jgi:hypothetical protein